MYSYDHFCVRPGDQQRVWGWEWQTVGNVANYTILIFGLSSTSICIFFCLLGLIFITLSFEFTEELLIICNAAIVAHEREKSYFEEEKNEAAVDVKKDDLNRSMIDPTPNLHT